MAVYQFGVNWVVNILLIASPIVTIYREWTLFYYMLEFYLSCFGILERDFYFQDFYY